MDYDNMMPPIDVLERMAKGCRGCAECGESPPCATCMAGGVCLERCRCGECDPDAEGDIEDWDNP